MHLIFKGKLSVHLWLNGFIYQQFTDQKKTLKESSLKSRFADGRDQPKNLEFSMNLSVF
jgi:hypothetical protein